MLRYLPLLLILSACGSRRGLTPPLSPEAEAAAYQAELSATYLDPERSILSDTKRARLAALGGLSFYPIDPAYHITAQLERYGEPKLLQMPTSSERTVEYLIYARANFELDGQSVSLDVLQSTNPYVPEEYKNLLFVPFRDATSGSETYGGGRYLDVPLPEGNTLVLDFNRAYHPYCAYSLGYSCPVPPQQNTLPVAVRAGVRTTDLGEDY